jgi:uracil-DNA glycosylase
MKNPVPFMKVKIEDSWNKFLAEEFKSEYFVHLAKTITEEYQTKIIFPEPNKIFRAFDLLPVEEVKVVILGQDPYHTPDVADGLAFSTHSTNKVPPSLQNIYKEICTQFNIDYTKYQYKTNPNLERWVKSGVLLLNTSLTVENGKANSHAKIGWDKFTDAVIKKLAKERKDIVFILWGANARKKRTLIEEYIIGNNLLVLESAHPSPLSCRNGFFGNGHFKDCNEFLRHNQISPVAW